MSAIDRLRKKHLQTRAPTAPPAPAVTKTIEPVKQAEPTSVVTKPNPLSALATLGKATAKGTSATKDAVSATSKMVVREACVGINIKGSGQSLLNRVGKGQSVAAKVEDKVAKREEAGMYTKPSALDGLLDCNGEEVMNQLRALDHALIAKTPDLGLLTIKIRKNLEQFPELTHILSDDQLGIICSGVLTSANVATEPKTKAAKSAAANRKIADLSTSIDLDDF